MVMVGWEGMMKVGVGQGEEGGRRRRIARLNKTILARNIAF